MTRQADEAGAGGQTGRRWAAGAQGPLNVVLNRTAGRGLAAREWPRLARELALRDLAYHLYDAGPQAARDPALQAARGPVLAVGGDGTVQALLPLLVGTARPLGTVPLGTGNDFAGLLDLHPGDLGAALDRLLRPPRPTDALEARVEAERAAPLLNGLGLGFDAQVAALLTQAPARLSGPGRYLWAALRGVRELSVGQVSVQLDGRDWYRGPAGLVAVMNGSRYGGGFRITPHADPADGLLDVVLGTELTRAGLLPLMGRVLAGRHLGHPLVRSARARQVLVRCEAPTQAHLDGELAGRISRLEAQVRPGAVLVYR